MDTKRAETDIGSIRMQGNFPARIVQKSKCRMQQKLGRTS